MPSFGVIQVTGVTRSFHYHHTVISQIAQVPERQFSELSVQVTVNNQGWDLEKTQNKEDTRDPSDESLPEFCFSSLLANFCLFVLKFKPVAKGIL